MKAIISEIRENPLLGRKELTGEIEFSGTTPSNAQVAELLGKELKNDSSTIVVRHIYTSFGSHKARVSAVVYNTPELRRQTEMLTKHLRKKAEEAGKKEEKKGEEAAAKKEG